jgi:hypothetical protein
MNYDNKVLQVVDAKNKSNNEGFELDFDYETPDSHAHVTIYKDGKNRAHKVYIGKSIEVEQIKKDFPMFF